MPEDIIKGKVTDTSQRLILVAVTVNQSTGWIEMSTCIPPNVRHISEIPKGEIWGLATDNIKKGKHEQKRP